MITRRTASPGDRTGSSFRRASRTRPTNVTGIGSNAEVRAAATRIGRRVGNSTAARVKEIKSDRAPHLSHSAEPDADHDDGGATRPALGTRENLSGTSKMSRGSTIEWPRALPATRPPTT